MPNIAIVGAQWGDEGKGKIVDLLTEKVQVVARYNGGHNAGHTIRIGDQTFVLHLIPSGILHPGILCVMGAGMVIDPWALDKEMAELAARGVAVDDNLMISDRAHLILPHHRALESLTEEMRGSRKIGTTQRGIGPAYEDKAGRRGVRMGDLLRPAALPERLQEARRHYEQICRGAGRAADVDWDQLASDLAHFGETLRPRITDVSLVLHRHMARGILGPVRRRAGHPPRHRPRHVSLRHLVERDRGRRADRARRAPDPPRRRDRDRQGVHDARRRRPAAFGDRRRRSRTGSARRAASSARPRAVRGGAAGSTRVVVRYSARVNGLDSLALTKLDVLDELPEILLCTGYRYGGELITEFPSDLSVLEGCEPVYERFPGWQVSTAGTRDFAALPDAARRYVERIAELVGTEVGIVSTGPARADTILRSGSAVTAWFE